MAKTHYLTNKDLLAEIHKSKRSFCWVSDPRYYDYHAIVDDKAKVTSELISSIIEEKAKPRGKTPGLIIAPEDVVIRVMTFDHIPDDPERKRRSRKTERPVAWTNFPPFNQVIMKDGALVEVVRSHWRGDLATGEFCITHGSMTNNLAAMFMLLVERIARRPNYSGYSYNDEMQSNALLNLCMSGLQFDESKSSNVFAFTTTSVNHSFIRILNLEGRAQSIRDDMLEDAGMEPSAKRQARNETGEAAPKKKKPSKKAK